MTKQSGGRQFTYQIPDRSEITRYLREHGEPVAFKRMAKELGMELPGERDAIRYRLRAMVRDGQIVSDLRNRYAIADRRTETLTGRVEATVEGYGFVVVEGVEDDVYLNKRQMSAVTHGDEVRIRLLGEDRRGRPQGEVVEVVVHGTKQIIGRLYYEGRLGFVEPMNPRISHRYLASDLPKGKHDGQVVILSVTEHPTQHNMPAGDITDVLGDHLTPALEVEVAIRNHDLSAEWPEQVLVDADRFPVKIPSGQIGQRVDLRSLPFVTIDGEDARDFDDAVYCESRPRGGYRLYVAIADVAHYVHPESALDQEAARRGTSVYFPRHVIPMLPEVLSNGLCSLRPDEDRLALVCDMTISDSGKLSGYHFSEAVIRSRARLTYTQVAGLLAGKTPEGTPEFEGRDADLIRLNALYKVLLTARGRRGALEFDNTDIDFQYDEQGHIESIVPTVRNDAHRIIEECMLCANVAAARLLSRQGKPGLYRVHEPPGVERCDQLRIFLARFGIQLTIGEEPAPTDFQAAIDAVAKVKNGQILQTVILRTMNQAVYQPNNRGHFGLNYTRYAHFTSPIRRYPDLLLHRLIKSLFASYEDVPVRRVAERKTHRLRDGYPYDDEAIVVLGEHCSFTERRAESAVYEVLDWLKCEFLSEQVGDEFDGVIAGVTRFGLFVMLVGKHIEGLIHISTLQGDYFRYDADNQSLIGDRTGREYGIGDPVVVQLARVDSDERRIDLELISHSPLKGRRRVANAGRDKGSRSADSQKKAHKRGKGSSRQERGERGKGRRRSSRSRERR